MSSSSAANEGLREVVPGAQVEHQGMPLGSVEEVIMDPRSGEPEAILVRHGRADYLLRVPARFVHPASPSSVEIANDLELDGMERTGLMSVRVPAMGEQ